MPAEENRRSAGHAKEPPRRSRLRKVLWIFVVLMGAGGAGFAYAYFSLDNVGHVCFCTIAKLMPWLF